MHVERPAGQIVRDPLAVRFGGARDRALGDDQSLGEGDVAGLRKFAIERELVNPKTGDMRNADSQHQGHHGARLKRVEPACHSRRVSAVIM
jgi:hypothetical protein